jgi:YD repeat-containing protein
MIRTIFLLLLLFSARLSAQSFGACSSCAWSDPGFQAVWSQLIISDTMAARMHISSVKIAATKDTVFAGYSMRSTNDPNCNDCRLVRFDSRGREEYVFYNNLAVYGGKLYKFQYVFNDDNTPKYVLKYAKDPSAEYDTAYHMYQYELITYYDRFSITKGYSSAGTGFSATPRQQPLFIITKTFDDKGRTLMEKTAYPANPGAVDSTVYSYTDRDTKRSLTFAAQKAAPEKKPERSLISARLEKSTNGKLAELQDTSYSSGAHSVTQYSYDSKGRLQSVATRGASAGTSLCGESGTSEEIRYNKDGLPLLIIFRGGGSFCALAFYYTYY